MYNYYINEELSEEYPKGNPREFKYGETHYIEVVDGTEDESTRVENTTNAEEYTNYDYEVSRMVAYGSVVNQVEYIAENGLDAWQVKITEIKEMYPKDIEDTAEWSKELC